MSARDYVECDDCQTTFDILEDMEIIEMFNCRINTDIQIDKKKDKITTSWPKNR